MLKNTDIQFSNLSSNQFEEFCFDLLLRLGFKNITWRKGGADSGRDIEAYFHLENPLINGYDEKWFFECKNSSKGVAPEELTSKLAWCDAERPDHIVFLLGSYLTNNARVWLKKIESQKSYKIHVLEGKNLINIALKISNLLINYFDGHLKILTDYLDLWLKYDLLPDLDALTLIHEQMNSELLSRHEIAFIWNSTLNRHIEIDEDFHEREFSLTPITQKLKNDSNTTRSIIPKNRKILPLSISGYGGILAEPFNTGLISKLMIVSPRKRNKEETVASKSFLSKIKDAKSDEKKYLIRLAHHSLYPKENIITVFYSIVVEGDEDNGTGIEVLIEQNSDFKSKIRYIKNDAWKIFRKMENIINMKN